MPTLVALGLGQLEAQATSLACDPSYGGSRGRGASVATGTWELRPAVTLGLASVAWRPRRAPRSRSRWTRTCSGSCSRFSCSSLLRVSPVARAVRGRTLTRRDSPRRPRRRRPRRSRPPSRRERLRRETPPRARTRALVRITIPGQDTVSLGERTWPSSTTADVQSFQLSRRRLHRQPRPLARRSSRSLTGEAAILAGARGCDRALPVRGRGDRRSGDCVGRPPARAFALPCANVSASAVQGAPRSRGRTSPPRRGASALLADWGSLSVLSLDSGSRRAGPALGPGDRRRPAGDAGRGGPRRAPAG